ncbi:hypothetical protein L198_03576 [Cryptococcus wingfieldii CBS 7118]|uniref:UDENN domain-containing protein n=1 Tax=Cryptococcus wingfieldii CBS 7118 TaxID=1295528 RepID=A0A1E3JBW4_9TREE|nr:hypothetical protein L198_03576 [Cryptococcus wingfieldii CBS 7118]ODN98332.1 hypothetical protein L198_03576 [Cryptococcus wingfieldii CBS 7118]
MSLPSSSSLPPQTPSKTSQECAPNINLSRDDSIDLDAIAAEPEEEAVHFCLLAEFDIDAGATLAYQYPYPMGTDEHQLAELMLPDGAHLRPEDWTVFYLGQTASNAVDPLLSHEAASLRSGTSDSDHRSTMMTTGRATRGVAGGGLLYVLNCVRMKEDKSMRRGAMVKALAICTPNPYIGIYKPLLLLALEEYFNNPSPEILSRLYDSANAISTAGMPRLSRNERILLRSSERKDLFEEKFGIAEPGSGTQETFEIGSSEDHSSGEGARSEELHAASMGHRKTLSSSSGIRMTRKGSSQSSRMLGTPSSSREGGVTPDFGMGEGGRRKGVPRDTHFFETEARFKKITVPIRIPMTIFDEDVGDYSIIELVQTFSQTLTPFPPPYHPHLHTNGASTHPIILIFNALLANKRVMFLGHGLPANQVARMVLAACALVSGCGQVLRGFPECAFPYANLASLDILEEFSGYVAGVTNPRFEDLHMTWDVLCNLETGKVTVSKNMKSGSISTGSVGSRKSSETSLNASLVKVEDDNISGTMTPQPKMISTSRADCVDNQFMEEIAAAMASHYGESNIRLRLTDYLHRFVRLAAYQEYAHTGSSKIGYPTVHYHDGQLGSGVVFADEQMKQREMWANGHRIDAWRKTNSYKLFSKDWESRTKRRAIEFDIHHQISRLRMTKNMSDSEADAIFSSLANGVRTYEQVVELLTHLPPHGGGIMPIANGLFHQWLGVRENTVDLLLTLQQYPIGRIAVTAMNYFHRKTLAQLLERREMAYRLQRERQLEQEEGYGSPTDGYSGGFGWPGNTATPQSGMARA